MRPYWALGLLLLVSQTSAVPLTKKVDYPTSDEQKGMMSDDEQKEMRSDEFPLNPVESIGQMLNTETEDENEKIKMVRTLADIYGKPYADHVATFNHLIGQLNKMMQAEQEVGAGDARMAMGPGMGMGEPMRKGNEGPINVDANVERERQDEEDNDTIQDVVMSLMRGKREADLDQFDPLCLREDCIEEKLRLNANNEDMCVGEDCEQECFGLDCLEREKRSAKMCEEGEEDCAQADCVGEDCAQEAPRKKRSIKMCQEGEEDCTQADCVGEDCAQENCAGADCAQDRVKREIAQEEVAPPSCVGPDCANEAKTRVRRDLEVLKDQKTKKRRKHHSKSKKSKKIEEEECIGEDCEAKADRVMEERAPCFGPGCELEEERAAAPPSCIGPECAVRADEVRDGFGFEYKEPPTSKLPADMSDIQALERDAEDLLKAIESKYNAEISKLKIIDEKLRELNMETDSRIELPELPGQTHLFTNGNEEIDDPFLDQLRREQESKIPAATRTAQEREDIERLKLEIRQREEAEREKNLKLNSAEKVNRMGNSQDSQDNPQDSQDNPRDSQDNPQDHHHEHQDHHGEHQEHHQEHKEKHQDQRVKNQEHQEHHEIQVAHQDHQDNLQDRAEHDSQVATTLRSVTNRKSSLPTPDPTSLAMPTETDKKPVDIAPDARLTHQEMEKAGFPRDAQGMAANALPKGLQDVLPKLSKSQMAGQPSMQGSPPADDKQQQQEQQQQQQQEPKQQHQSEKKEDKKD